MRVKVIVYFLFASILLNGYLLLRSMTKEKYTGDSDFIDQAIGQIQELKKSKGISLDGYFLPGIGQEWPPNDVEMKNGVELWNFRSNGTARKFFVSPIQQWKNDDGKIYIQWPTEEFRYYGRFDGEYLTEDHGDYNEFYFRAE